MTDLSAKQISRIVLDTSSLITALRSPSGAARALLKLILQQKIPVVMDLRLSLEYRAVTMRPEHLRVMQATPEEVLRTLEELERLAEAVEVIEKVRPISSDPNDDMIIELAVAASAEAIVTNNKRHLGVATVRFGIQWSLRPSGCNK